jgi:hypothetical protein
MLYLTARTATSDFDLGVAKEKPNGMAKISIETSIRERRALQIMAHLNKERLRQSQAVPLMRNIILKRTMV